MNFKKTQATRLCFFAILTTCRLKNVTQYTAAQRISTALKGIDPSWVGASMSVSG